MKKKRRIFWSNVLFVIAASGIVALGVLGLYGLHRCTDARDEGYADACLANARRKGRAELPCKTAAAEFNGSNVLVHGCGRAVTYECYDSTPEKEGSRALRLSGD